MADYWKSLPRKFCDICKCWFADNKASIDFHEKGKRHQENVNKKINELQKKGLKEYEAQKNLEKEMRKIEEAALEAYKKDLETNVDLTGKLIVSKTSKENELRCIEKEDSMEGKGNLPVIADTEETVPEKQWYEAMTEEGHLYYWNVNTSESQWEPPEDGYVSIQEQQQCQSMIDDEQTNENPKNEKDQEQVTSSDEEKETSTAADGEIPEETIGPKPKPDPYGKWVAVTPHVVEDPVDLQLPEKLDDTVEMHIPLSNEDTRFKIKEKVIGHLDDSFSSQHVFFKKRKNISDVKRSVRQRLNEDD